MNSKRLSKLIATGGATEANLEAMGIDGILSAKASANTVQIRAHKGGESEAGEGRTVRFIASDETTDRMGDIIKVAGWDHKNFDGNPVILWGHDQDGLPIGKGKASVGVKANGEPALFIDVDFATAEQYKFADTVYQLAKDGFLNAVSVGFMPKKWTFVEDEAERKELGLGQWGVLYDEVELLEVSVVSVPANPSALQAGMKSLVSKGLLSEGDADEFNDACMVTERDMAKRLDNLAALVKKIEEPAEEPAEEPEEPQEPESTNETDGITDTLAAIADSQSKTADALAAIAVGQKEHTNASRQLVDVLSDFVKRMNAPSGVDGGSVPDAVAPEAKGKSAEEIKSAKKIADALEGLMEAIKTK